MANQDSTHMQWGSSICHSTNTFLLTYYSGWRWWELVCCCFLNNISLPMLEWITSLLPIPQFFFFLSGDHWLFSESVRLFLFGKEVHLYPFLVPSYKWYLMLISLPVSLTSLAMIISALFPEASHGILSCLLWLSDGSSSMYPIFFIPYGRLCLQIFFSILSTVSLSFRVPLLCKCF